MKKYRVIIAEQADQELRVYNHRNKLSGEMLF